MESFRDFLRSRVGLMAQVWYHFFQGDILFLIAPTPHHAGGTGVLTSWVGPKPGDHKPLLFLKYLLFLVIWQWRDARPSLPELPEPAPVCVSQMAGCHRGTLGLGSCPGAIGCPENPKKGC